MKSNYYKFHFLILLLLFSAQINFTQNNNTPPCSSIEAKQFDFWVGNWDIFWITQKGDTAYGNNNVEKILGGCVINENFITKGPQPFNGKSYSVYNSVKKMWEQTWVDGTGAYMTFTGKFENDKMTLSRQIRGKNNDVILQRMVFYNITKDKLDWDWEASKDNGKTWQLNWRLHYIKHKKS